MTIISPHRRKPWHERSELRQLLHNIGCAVALGIMFGAVVALAVSMGPVG